MSKLLNGTAGVRRVASSKVHRVFEPSGARSEGEGGGSASVRGAGLNKLSISFNGVGNYGAHRLLAVFESERGVRTQLLFVSLEAEMMGEDELREMLRVMQPVLEFVLDEEASAPYGAPVL